MPRKSQEQTNSQPQPQVEGANQASAENPPVQVEELTFRVERLRANAKDLFDVPVEVFDGAMHGLSKAKITKVEATERIREFLSKEV
ncbi:hypothetical protein EDM56_12020 [Brevibacillus fluminis]|uniref:YqzN/YkzM domain-containing protein n=1 Tax=Brevibacillus fluminis TaxID=511487 RepID=A0A3M8DP48_9BACL|nr:hypothetical protein [Brevibacillus fluminis]RNB89878.1 hypothetical protein EDM56_12020 [Brevibacillus fluminis]